MAEVKTSHIIYASSYSEANISSEDLRINCGSLTQLNDDKDNYIVIDLAKTNDNIPVNVVNEAYYAHEGRTDGITTMFYPTTVKSNITDRVFHEIGHLIYDKKPQNNVIIYNNYARQQMGLPLRKNDEHHNRLKR